MNHIDAAESARVTPEYRVQRFAEAGPFLERAGNWLLAAEAENNLIIGLALRMQQDVRAFQRPVYLAVIEENGEVAGCVMRTPPYKPILTRMPLAAVPLVSADLHGLYDSIPAVIGPDAQARCFADAWSSTTGIPFSEGRHSRIYQLSRVRPPLRPASGAVEIAQMHHLELVTSWIVDFSTEVEMPTYRARGMAEERIGRGELFLWVDDTVRSMAAFAGTTPNSVRIGYVYTPREWRGRGYASSCTAQVSQRALDAGFRYCFLFTDTSNPTSNAIYQAIGYEPVCDVNDYVFTVPA